MIRYLQGDILQDLKEKMVFLAGPRQSGKTTLAKNLLKEQMGESWADRYLNWDHKQDRDNILKEHFPAQPGLLVLDEIHKYKNWRQTVKGLFDKRREQLQILVTGSARLDYYRRGGDSLQGRYHLLHLHPLSCAELQINSLQDMAKLLKFGGFPEPFFSQSEAKSKRWSKEYKTRFVQEDLVTLEKISDIVALELLMDRLPDLVGSPLSINNLRQDLKVSHPTITRWIEILERLFFIFRVFPYGADKLRAVKKEAKCYHYDWSLISNSGARFENFIACHLLKFVQYQYDKSGDDWELRYFRDIDGREVDFVVTCNQKPMYFVEAKNSDSNLSKHLAYLKNKFPEVPAWQLLNEKDLDVLTAQNIRISHALHFLKTLV